MAKRRRPGKVTCMLGRFWLLAGQNQAQGNAIREKKGLDLLCDAIELTPDSFFYSKQLTRIRITTGSAVVCAEARKEGQSEFWTAKSSPTECIFSLSVSFFLWRK